MTSGAHQPTRFEVAVLVGLALILSYQLIVPPAVGLADNGDFPRIAGPFRLGSDISDTEKRYFRYFIREWQFDDKYKWNSGFSSSEMLFVGLALPLNGWFSKKGLFDMRALGAVHSLAFLLAAWLLLRRFRERGPLVRATVAACLLVVFADVGYVAYFNSYYSESASFLFLLLTVALALLLLRMPRQPSVTLAAFVACAVLFVSAKPQNAVLGLILALVLARWGSLYPERAWKAACAALAALLAVVSVWYQFSTPRLLAKRTYYIALFSELLGNSPTPEQDLKELGLPLELVKYRGTHPFIASIPPNVADFTEPSLNRLTLGHIVRFYAKHPGRMYRSLDRSGRYALAARPWLGNFERSVGLPPFATSQACALWSTAKQKIVPHTAAGLGLWFAAALAALLVCYLRQTQRQNRLLIEFLIALLLLAVAQFVLVALYQGTIDPAKHMFLFNLLFDIGVATALVGAASWIETGDATGFRLPFADQARFTAGNRSPTPESGKTAEESTSARQRHAGERQRKSFECDPTGQPAVQRDGASSDSLVSMPSLQASENFYNRVLRVSAHRERTDWSKVNTGIGPT